MPCLSIEFVMCVICLFHGSEIEPVVFAFIVSEERKKGLMFLRMVG